MVSNDTEGTNCKLKNCITIQTIHFSHMQPSWNIHDDIYQHIFVISCFGRPFFSSCEVTAHFPVQYEFSLRQLIHYTTIKFVFTEVLHVSTRLGITRLIKVE